MKTTFTGQGIHDVELNGGVRPVQRSGTANLYRCV